MKPSFKTVSILLWCALLLFASLPALAQTSQPGLSGDSGTTAVSPCANCPNPNCPKKGQGMGMMHGGMGQGGGMGMMHGSRMGMQGGMGMKGGMMGMPGRQFYLNQAQELGLSPQQIGELQSIRNECKRNNIPLMAQIRVIKLDMKELLASENWSVDQAQQLIQQMTQIRAQMMTNHLQNLKKAQQVLTAEQRRRAVMGEMMINSGEEDED